jgi:hypothetical protein
MSENNEDDEVLKVKFNELQSVDLEIKQKQHIRDAILDSIFKVIQKKHVVWHGSAALYSIQQFIKFTDLSTLQEAAQNWIEKRNFKKRLERYIAGMEERYKFNPTTCKGEFKPFVDQFKDDINDEIDKWIKQNSSANTAAFRASTATSIAQQCAHTLRLYNKTHNLQNGVGSSSSEQQLQETESSSQQQQQTVQSSSNKVSTLTLSAEPTVGAGDPFNFGDGSSNDNNIQQHQQGQNNSSGHIIEASHGTCDYDMLGDDDYPNRLCNKTHNLQNGVGSSSEQQLQETESSSQQQQQTVQSSSNKVSTLTLSAEPTVGVGDPFNFGDGSSNDNNIQQHQQGQNNSSSDSEESHNINKDDDDNSISENGIFDYGEQNDQQETNAGNYKRGGGITKEEAGLRQAAKKQLKIKNAYIYCTRAGMIVQQYR